MTRFRNKIEDLGRRFRGTGLFFVMHAAIVVGLKVDSRKGAGINAVVGSSDQSVV